jgi:hypothetical protein
MSVKYSFILFVGLIITSCEKIINIDVSSSNPRFVAEATISKDSVCHARLSLTSDYFSYADTAIVENAVIRISDGVNNEELIYMGKGQFMGKSIRGVEGIKYELKIEYNGTSYVASSQMPAERQIISVYYFKTESQSVLNPYGKRMYTITCDFTDDPSEENYYMIWLTSGGRLISGCYYLLTEYSSNEGVLNNLNDTINFSDSFFYDGGLIEFQLYSIDKPVYDYFIQMNDILFWKRRVIPPNPYNPVSNINNDALGYFAAWTVNSREIELE